MDNGRPTIPAELVVLLTSDRLGHVSSVRHDGSIASYLMWIDWDGEHLVTSSPVGSRKGQNWRANPQAAMSVVAADDPWRFVLIRGRVTAIRPDQDLAFIDKMSLRYTGQQYRWRDAPREVFEITPDYIRTSGGQTGRRVST